MLEKEFYIITFESTHLAISTEKTILAEVAVEMVPTPREISASCGLSLKVGLDTIEKVLSILDERPKENMKLYHMIRENGLKIPTLQVWRD
jgi:hypothetical protein